MSSEGGQGGGEQPMDTTESQPGMASSAASGSELDLDAQLAQAASQAAMTGGAEGHEMQGEDAAAAEYAMEGVEHGMEDAGEAAPPPPITVCVPDVGEITIERAGLDTVQDLLNELEQQSVITEGKTIVDHEQRVIDADTPIEAITGPVGLSLKLTVLVVHNLHGAEFVTVWNSTTNTVGALMQALRHYVFQRTGIDEPIPCLTFQGRLLSEHERVDLLPGMEQLLAENHPTRGIKDALKIVGTKEVSIMDIDMGDQSSRLLTNLNDHMTIAQVLRMYGEQMRRAYLHQPIVGEWVDGNTVEDLKSHAMNLDATLYAQNISNGEERTNLGLKTSMFEIVLKEQTALDEAAQTQRARAGTSRDAASKLVEGIRIQVYDYFTVARVKELYSMIAEDPLGSEDRLWLLDSGSGGAAAAAAAAMEGVSSSQRPQYRGELDEGSMLFKYLIGPDAELSVQREDVSAAVCEYLCADCGSDVRLKQRDAVRCRQCGHRIVFKKRIPKPQQYICR